MSVEPEALHDSSLPSGRSSQPSPQAPRPGQQSSLRFTVNGRAVQVQVPPIKRLADVLRDDLGLTGTKLGCHAGDCGACTVQIDGEQHCACLVAAGQCEGRSVRTVEGLADTPGPGAESGADPGAEASTGVSTGTAGLNALQRAFLEHGAAQCGICTPGMLMAAQSVLDRIANPDREQVLDGLGGVLCRCTGYQKIVEAVLAVVRQRQTGIRDKPVGELSTLAAGAAVGARLQRLDGLAKVTGHERYGADEVPADALWLRVLRSPHARARFVFGDLAAFVAARPGLVGWINAADIPFNRFAIFPDLRDQPALAEGFVRMRGEAVLALVGSRVAIEALSLNEVPVEWQVDTPVLEIGAALDDAARGGAPLHERWSDNILCHGRVARGDVEAVLPAAITLEAAMTTAHVEHAYIEPEAGYAHWTSDSERGRERVRVFATTQTPYMDRDELASMFQLEPDQVHIVPSAVGGGFGGKLDLSVQPLIVAAARKFGRPACVVFDRPESMASSTKRHPAQMTARLSADGDGQLLAYDFSGDFNTGPYSSWGPTVANRVPIHASGPYRIANVRAVTRAVLTNNANCGAFRGFGVPQSTLINELLVDRMAEACRADPLEFRLRHALRAGDTTPTGQRLVASVGLEQCLLALRPAWRAARQRVDSMRSANDRSPLRRGLGIACMWYGIGNTVIANPSSMTIGLRPDGRFCLYNGAIDIGQGTFTIMAQIAADALGVPVALIDQVGADTDLTRDAGKSSASRQTFVSGNAARLAALDLRTQLLERLGAPDDAALQIVAGELHAVAGGQPEAGRGEAGQPEAGRSGSSTRRLKLADWPVRDDGLLALGQGYFNPPTVPLDADGQGVPYACYGFAAQFAEVEVDIRLGTVRVLNLHAAHDVGRAINPTQVEGQIHGGIAQGLGLALMEEYVAGRTDNLHDYLIPTVGDMPEIVTYLIEDPEPLGPYGAKGVGEPALVATAPAILNAIHNATGVRPLQVPVTPDRLLALLNTAGPAVHNAPSPESNP